MATLVRCSSSWTQRRDRGCPTAGTRPQCQPVQAASTWKVGARPGWKSGCAVLRETRAKSSFTATAPPAHSNDAAPAVVTGPAPASSPTSFDWFGRWWPVHPVDGLVPKEPLHVDLLGLSLVVWADAAGDWHVLDDKCPHRLAPLSEGRIEPEGLHCAYHGWTFDGHGACTSIPQLAALPAERQAAACASPRARVASYPTYVAHGLLWVWPQAGAWGAALNALPTIDGLTSIRGQRQRAWFVRDLPIRYDTLMENNLDPSHVQYAHHGVLGDRYSLHPISRGWLHMEVGTVQEDGFTVRAPTAADSNAVENWVQFAAPHSVKYRFGGAFTAEVFILPTKPGWSRLLVNAPVRAPSLPGPLNNLPAVVSARVAWDHIITRNAVFDGDVCLLHTAERLLPPSKGIGSDAVSRAYYLPAAADGVVLQLRRWFQQFAGPVPTCRPEDEAAMPPVMPKEQVLDRWTQHTQYCSHCKQTLARLDALNVSAAVAGLLAAVAAVAQIVVASVLSGPLNVWPGLQAAGLLMPTAVCAAVALAAVVLRRWLGYLRQHFMYVPYVHAHRD